MTFSGPATGIWQQLIDPALSVAVDDGGERGGPIGQRINAVEFAGFDERGDGRSVLSQPSPN
jgi:hypothetical protein